MSEIESSVVFPQDEGTGLPQNEADWSSGGHFAGLASHPNNSNYVASGMNFENIADGEFDITGGHAFIEFEDGVDVQDESGNYTRDWDSPVIFALEANTTSGVEYEVNETNHVFIDLDLSGNNQAEYVVNTTGDAPSEPSLKIGEIDSFVESISFVEDSSGGEQFGPFESVRFVEEGTGDSVENIEVVSFIGET